MKMPVISMKTELNLLNISASTLKIIITIAKGNYFPVKKRNICQSLGRTPFYVVNANLHYQRMKFLPLHTKINLIQVKYQ